MSLTKLFLFSNKAHLNCYWNCTSHQACCLLYYLCTVNSGIHIYQFTFELLHFCFQIWLWFRISTNLLAIDRFDQNKGTNRQIYMPLFTPSYLEQAIVGKVFFVKLQITSKTFHTYLKPVSKVIHSQMVCSIRTKEVCCRAFSITLFIFCQTDQGRTMVCY